MKAAGHYLSMISITSAMQASIPFSMFVIPGKDQGTHASDKHQTRLKGRRVERCFTAATQYLTFRSLVTARDDGPKGTVYESRRTLPAYDSHIISHAGQHTFLNVRHPWQGPGNLCSRQATNLTQRTASRTMFTTAMLFLTFRSLVLARDDGQKSGRIWKLQGISCV